jgi:hypothetical protein
MTTAASDGPTGSDRFRARLDWRLAILAAGIGLLGAR